jgi:hypothetical protein
MKAQVRFLRHYLKPALSLSLQAVFFPIPPLRAHYRSTGTMHAANC